MARIGCWYMTGYRANWVPLGKHEDVTRPGNYSAFLWASSPRQARKLAQLRGLGERVVCTSGRAKPYRTASETLGRRTVGGKTSVVTAQLHGLAFLGMLALASGVATVQEVLGDQGFIHAFCHRGTDRRVLIARVKEIERRVPGYLPGNRKYPND